MKRKKNTAPKFDKKLLKKMAKFLNFNYFSVEQFGHGSATYQLLFRNRITQFPNHDNLYISTGIIYVDDGMAVLFHSGQDPIKEFETIAMKGQNIFAINFNKKDVVLWPKNMSKEEAEIRLDLLIAS